MKKEIVFEFNINDCEFLEKNNGFNNVINKEQILNLYKGSHSLTISFDKLVFSKDEYYLLINFLDKNINVNKIKVYLNKELFNYLYCENEKNILSTYRQINNEIIQITFEKKDI